MKSAQTAPRTTVVVLGLMQALSGRLPDILLRAGLAAPLAASLGLTTSDIVGVTRGFVGAAAGVLFAIWCGAPALSSRGIRLVSLFAAAGMVITTTAGSLLSGTTGLGVVALAQNLTGFMLGLTLTLRPAVLADRGPVGGANLAIERISAAGGAALVILAGAVGSVWGWRVAMYVMTATLVTFGVLVAWLWRNAPSGETAFGRVQPPRVVFAEVWSAMGRPGVLASMVAGTVVYAGLGAVLIGVAIQLAGLGTSPLTVALVVSSATLVAAGAARVFNPYAGAAPRAVAVSGFVWYAVAFGALAASAPLAHVWHISLPSLWWCQLGLAWLAVMLVEFARSPVKATSHAAMQRLRGQETATVAHLTTLLYWAAANVGSWVAVLVPQGTREWIVDGAVLGTAGMLALTRATRRGVAHTVRAANADALEIAVHVGPDRLLTLMVRLDQEWRLFNRVGCGGLLKLVRVEKAVGSSRSALRSPLMVARFDIPVPGPAALWRWRFRAPSDGASCRLPAWVPRDFNGVPGAPRLRVRLRRTRPVDIEVVGMVRTLGELDGGAASKSRSFDRQALIAMLQHPDLGLEVGPATEVVHLKITSPSIFGQLGAGPTDLEVTVFREEHHDTPVPEEPAAGRRRWRRPGTPAPDSASPQAE
jgi:hypothetical protein